MASFAKRYAAGEHTDVWRDIHALGPVPPRHENDVADVATQTMRAAARQIADIDTALAELGHVAVGLPRLEPTSDDQAADLDSVREELGPIPAAFDACLRWIGGVWFAGDCPALGLAYDGPDSIGLAAQLDPLALPTAQYFVSEWRQWVED